MDKEVLEVVLRNSEKESSSIQRIIEMECESFLPNGENYASTIFKLTPKVVLGNGRIAKKSFILKKEIVDQFTGGGSEQLKLSTKEFSVYTNILREMEYLMEEFQDTEGPFWCKLIYFDYAESIIVLENLKASGFSTVKRTELQDLEHARLAIRSLGRYHAMAKVLEERGLVSRGGYREFPILHGDEFVRAVLYGGLKALVVGMRATWGEEWTEIADTFSQVSFDKMLEVLKNNANFHESPFKCLNHGDCWNNNMMFKYNWEGRPIDIRLIDFQCPHYNTPCFDLVYYMYTSIKPHIRRQNYSSLIALYHESLTCYLDRFGYKGSKPGLDEINDVMDRLSFYGLSIFASGYAIDTYTSTDAMDIKKLFETKGEEGLKIEIFNEPRVRENTGDDLRAYVKIIKKKVID